MRANWDMASLFLGNKYFELVSNGIKSNGVRYLSTAHWQNLSALNLGNQTLSELKMQLETWGVSG